VTNFEILGPRYNWQTSKVNYIYITITKVRCDFSLSISLGPYAWHCLKLVWM